MKPASDKKRQARIYATRLSNLESTTNIVPTMQSVPDSEGLLDTIVHPKMQSFPLVSDDTDE